MTQFTLFWIISASGLSLLAALVLGLDIFLCRLSKGVYWRTRIALASYKLSRTKNKLRRRQRRNELLKKLLDDLETRKAKL